MDKKIYIYILAALAVVILAGIYVDKSARINTSQPLPKVVQNTAASVLTDKTIQPTPTPVVPMQTHTTNNTTPNMTISFNNYGLAPDFKTGDNWLNSQPLTMADLKGKVVLVEFWTYDCINCIHTLPYVTKWYNTYKNDGFMVVGVHTPEFAYEQDADNVKNAMAGFGIYYPVVQDNDYAIWNSYSNEYWPAQYLINQQGEIVYEHFGEGNYDITENAIRQLLGLNTQNTQASMNNPSQTNNSECVMKKPICKT